MTGYIATPARKSSTEESRLAGQNNLTGYLVSAIAVFVGALMLAPLVLSFFASIKPSAEASAVPPSYFPHSFSLENYEHVIHFGAGLGTYVGNSLGVATLAIIFSLVLSVPAGFGLARFKIPYKEVLFVILLAPLMIPYQTLLTPLYFMFAKLGFANSLIGLAVVHTILQIPFSVYLMRNAFE
ncbi:MAG: carbohydrate ABC transporter permease, partial [Aestuariivirga sp.]